MAEFDAVFDKDFKGFLDALETASPVEVRGRVTEVTGLVVKAVVPGVSVGELCHIKVHHRNKPVRAEVVGFKDESVYLMPLGSLEGIGPGSEVVPSGNTLTVRVGPRLLGRVLNGLGDPMDHKGDLVGDDFVDYPVMQPPPDPLERQRILKPIEVGVRAIDATLTCGEGQRIGVFAAAGVGKSTLLGMIARNTEAEVSVICLIGERGREVRDFLEKDLGEEGLKRSVCIVATSDQPSLVRLKSAYVATAIAEYYRDTGKKVVLMMDSSTRFARSQREIGLAIGEPPARAGYTPSVFSELPKLLERTGNSSKGSITAFYTVLVAGDDMNEPVADEVRSILDGHIILSRNLAASGHYPAIDVSQSVSRVMESIAEEKHKKAARKLREILATYEKQRDLILIGAYQKGSDPRVDYAIAKIDEVNNFLQQGLYEKMTFQQCVEGLCKLFEN
ncbi:MAG TPA: flagellar protein export ATPase FliI [Acidobacteriota bacterium]|nr:flagellar protein export ATPase FliI [Acidobacteriota bacterium]